MYVNDLEVIRMRHGEMQREAAEARLAKEALMARRQEKNARVVTIAPVANTASSEMKKPLTEPKLIPHTR